MLQEVIDGSFGEQYLIRSYTRSFNGFAAHLTEKERQKIASFEGVVSVFPSRHLKLLTTRSWDFMGFPEAVRRDPMGESDVIIGVIDTGIWPESESFDDEGFGPVPSKWKGACNGGRNFTCNKKLIGARWYGTSGTTNGTARDSEGHGTHTASIAAGNAVQDVSFYGLASGTARGGVPSARIAAYRLCYKDDCVDDGLLAAFDDAISDGVDIISLSYGLTFATDLTSDPTSIGAFHAMERGVLTVHAAGNFGKRPTPSVAPWVLTVAASGTDRRIVNKAILGDGTTLIGNSINSFHLNGKQFPLIHRNDLPSQCRTGTRCKFFKAKILVGDAYSQVVSALEAGVVGAIIPCIDDEDDFSNVEPPLPAAALSLRDIDYVQAYMNSTRLPKATITSSVATRNVDARVVAAFSSRGPNKIVPEVLKPDITAPGMEILAAFSPVHSPSLDSGEKRSVNYEILSGTSMACPHVAGAAAYVKSFHPDWSPSAIKSALMTTAWRMNVDKNPDAEFSFGAGHINPVKAASPGLVYETSRDDYVKMLCNMDYNLRRIGRLFGGNTSCPKGVRFTPKDLNLPSMAFRVEGNSLFTVKFRRVVRNVGLANSTYRATILGNPLLRISVEPSTLCFTALNEKKSFIVSVEGGRPESSTASGSLLWSDGSHSVRSPIVVYQYNFTSS